MLLGFFVAGLLDAGAIQKRVKGEPLGAARSLQLALLKPVVAAERRAAAGPAGRGPRTPRSAAASSGTTPRRGEGRQKPHWPRTITRGQPLRL